MNPPKEDLTAQAVLLKAACDSTGDGLIAIDEKGTILIFNPAAEKMFGYAAGEVMGKNVSLLMPSPDREQHDGYIARYMQTGEARIIGREREVEALRKDGSRFHVGLMIAEMRIAGPRRFIGVVRDISERKAVEAELDLHRHHLEEAIEERTRELSKSYEDLRKAEQMASIGELAAKIAHEIKNPIAGIYAAIQLLSRDVPAGDRKKAVFEDVAAEIRRLDETVQDLLRFARPIPPKPVRVDLRNFLSDVVEHLKKNPQVAKHSIRISAPEGLVVSLDPKLMEQSFSNLILNACQAMQKSGTVRIAAASAERGVEIDIEDTGSGISADALPSIFEPFFTTKSRGTGLGLSITKKNIEAHGGTISVQSAVGKGTTFRIVLPIGTKLA